MNIPIKTYIYLFIKHHPFPTPQDWHASCQEMSYSKRETKLKKERKNKINSPLYVVGSATDRFPPKGLI